jgi:IMP dehydrogenase
MLHGLLIDVANGHSLYMKEMIQRVQDIAPDLKIIAGSIATGEGFRFLAELGVSAVRCGISGGSICKTRIMTGHGMPTFQSVCDAYEIKRRDFYEEDKSSSLSGVYRLSDKLKNVAIIADGGIRYPADFVKSLAGGADAVMCGRIFAATDETPGEEIEIGPSFAIGHLLCAGIKAKVYRGAASAEIQLDKRGGMRADTCAEGVSTTIQCAGPVKTVLAEFCGGLRSGMTYADARNLAELRGNAQFVRVTSNGVAEGHAFGTRKE